MSDLTTDDVSTHDSPHAPARTVSEPVRPGPTGGESGRASPIPPSGRSPGEPHSGGPWSPRNGYSSDSSPGGSPSWSPSPSSPSSPSSSPGASVPPEATVARLLEEAEVEEDPARKSVLLHEAAELEERVEGDSLRAAREYLAAFNADGSFREPLEALVRILQQRRSLRNLGRVYESLFNAADRPDERSRALRAMAGHTIDLAAGKGKDGTASKESKGPEEARGRARELLLGAVHIDRADETSWLMLELDAGARGDPVARREALAARAALTTDPRWAALLRIDLALLDADTESADGVDAAVEALADLVRAPQEEAWRACEALERVARMHDRGDDLAWALLQRGEIVVESLGDAPGPRGQGVPPSLRSRGVATDAFIGAAAAHRATGKNEEEIAALERALEVDPDAMFPSLARIAAVARLGDLDRAAQLAREMALRGVPPEVAASLWLTVAEAALARGDRGELVEACERLLYRPGEPPGKPSPSEGALVSWTLLVDLLADGSDPKRLAGMLEADAAARPTAPGRAQGFLQAALARALFADDRRGARTALARAVTHGLPPQSAARLGRVLAATTPMGGPARAGESERPGVDHDPLWYEEESLRLHATTTDPSEAADLEIDIARERLARGDRAGALSTLASLLATRGADAADPDAELPAYGALASVLRVVLADVGAPGEHADVVESAGSAHALDAALGALPTGGRSSAAVSLAVARASVASARGDVAARDRALEALGTVSPDDELGSFVRASAAMRSDPARAASALRDLSRSLPDPISRDVVRVAAAFLLAHAGSSTGALDITSELESDLRRAFAPARAIWARHAARGDEQRRREAIEAGAHEAPLPSPWSALERIIDRLVMPGESPSHEPSSPSTLIEELLADLAWCEEPSLARAALLLQAAWPDDSIPSDVKYEALQALGQLGDDAPRLVARANLRRAHRQSDPDVVVASAEAWTQAGGGAASALEMLIASGRAADSAAEVRARSALASRLTGTSSTLLAATATLTAHVAGLPLPPLPDPVPLATPTAGESEAQTHPELDTTMPLALCAFELAPPGCDPARREAALLSLASIIDPRSRQTPPSPHTPQQSPQSPQAPQSPTMFELAAWSALAREDYPTARRLFGESLRLAHAVGDEPRSAIEGAIETELAANAGRPTRHWAELVERLARAVEEGGDTVTAAALWEHVGHGWWDALGNASRGERALYEAFLRDHYRKDAFDRVFRAVRGRKEDTKLLHLIEQRLNATDDPTEMAKLFWEQARVYRTAGDIDESLSSLENVTMLEPDHVGALALSAEIYVGRQQFGEAATALDRLSRQAVPPQQKLGAGLGAADLYESKLDAPEKSLAVLLALDEEGLGDVGLHERIARAAARAEAWEAATTYLEKLVQEREDSAGRVEAAHLAAAIYRDRMGTPMAAMPSLLALLREFPDDAEALEQLLDIGPPPVRARDTLWRSLQTVRVQLEYAPTDDRFARIVSRIATTIGDYDLRQIALGVLGAIGAATKEEGADEDVLVARLGTAPAVALDVDGARRLASPDEPGPVLELFRIMAPTIAEALGPSLDTFGLGRRDRIEPRSGSRLRNEVSAWAGALGLKELDVFVGGRDADTIQGVPGEPPALVFGPGVHAPLSLVQRARVVREIVALLRGTTVVGLRDDASVAAIVVSACALVGVSVPSPPYPVLEEIQRLIAKASTRKTKRALGEAANAVARDVAAGRDLLAFRGAALRTLDRAAVLAVGDVSAALAHVVPSGATAAMIAGDARAHSIVRFVWSDDYLALRKQLGLGIG